MAALALTCAGVSGCSDDDDNASTWETYREWRETNQTWLAQQEALKDADGTPFYQKVEAQWHPGAYILLHQFNDPAETAGNLVPMSTSWVSSYYDLYLYNDELVDASANIDGGVFTSQVKSLIQGWQIALANMHVGDTVQIVVPYQWAYKDAYQGDIPPYSALRFNMRLKDIPAYEVRP